jgi:TonB-linked SusC/RagA family outer membrane protein
MKKWTTTFLLMLFSGIAAMAQARPVKGRVLDENGEGLPGASITVKGTTTGTITDVDGSFLLEVPDDKNILIVNGVGYAPQEINGGDGDKVLSVKMVVSGKMLDEAVVVGYGTTSRKTMIGGASVIKEKAFKDVPVANFTNMLQGKASGVQVTSVNGAPGGAAYIRIRGVGSINAGQGPLIVIDGVPSTAEAYSALNPNDIADVSVLKDASTAGIYGSRGSNGVVMVTTKKGGDKNAAPRITYGFQYGFKSKTKDNYRMMTAEEKLKYERDLGYTNEYLAPLLAADSLESIVDATNPEYYWNQLRPYQTDWMKEILRTGRFSRNDLSIAGSSDKIDYYFSLENYSEDGISVASNYKRKSGVFTVDYKATPWLKIGESIKISQYSSQQLRDIGNAQNPFTAMYMYNPYEAPYSFEPGNKNGYNPTTQGFNVLEALRTNPSSSRTEFGSALTFLELTPINNFTFRTQLGLQYSNTAGESFMRPGSILDGFIYGPPTGQKTDNGNDRFNYVWTNTAEYKKTFNEDHSVKFLVGTEFTKDQFKSYSLTSTGYPLDPNLNTQNNAAKPTATSTTKQAWTIFSLFARGEYSYKGKYLASASIRRDGSSVFGTDTRYGNFFAGGLGWLMSEEDFIKSVHQINVLKLWASLGSSGNNNIGPYVARPVYSSGGYNGFSSFYPGEVGNPLLTWEKNTNYSVGLDFAFFDNRLSGSIDYYNRYTHALLLQQPLSVTTGYTSQLFNIGAMKNHGMELSLNYDVIKTKDIRWSVGGNITLNKNKIIRLVDGADIPNPNTGISYFSVDQPVDVYYLKKYAGVDKSNGNELWYKKDGSTTSSYSDADLFILDNKSPDPKYYGGLNTSVSYKGLQLSIDFYYSGGNYIYNQAWSIKNNAENVNQNMAADALDYWTPTNINAANPRADYNIPGQLSDRWLQKGDFIRLRNVMLSYSLPQSLVSKAKMQALTFFVQGTNLWYHAAKFKGDPEVGIDNSESTATRAGSVAAFSYPQTKAVTFGLNVTF